MAPASGIHQANPNPGGLVIIGTLWLRSEAGAVEFTVEELARLLQEMEAWAGGADQIRVFCYPSRVGGTLARCIFDGSQVRSEEWTSIGWEPTRTSVADILAAPRATWAELAEIGVPEADW